MQLYYDNKSTMGIVHNLIQYDRTKHIEIDKKFIKDNPDRSLMVITHVPTHPYSISNSIHFH